MSRFSDNYDDDSDTAVLDQGRWEHNARVALKGKRGRKALAELREALLALPQKRLIEGAICTVDAGKRRAALVAQATKSWESFKPEWRGASPCLDEADELDRLVQRDGEGVCAVGAYVWYRKVKAGVDPAEAFAGLPDLAEEGGDGLSETADFAKQQAGLTYTLAWDLAYRNDETYARKTPEERYTAFLTWIDQELAS